MVIDTVDELVCDDAASCDICSGLIEEKLLLNVELGTPLYLKELRWF